MNAGAIYSLDRSFQTRELPIVPWEKQFDAQDALRRAMHAFWSRGFEATSMQDLVNATGVNRASLYANIWRQAGPVPNYSKPMTSMFVGACFANSRGKRAPREAIRGVFIAFVDELASGQCSSGCLLTNTALELAAHDAQVRDIVASAQVDIERFFREQIDRGHADGSIDTGVESAAAAQRLLAMLLGLLVLVRSRPEKDLLHSIVDQAIGTVA